MFHPRNAGCPRVFCKQDWKKAWSVVAARNRRCGADPQREISDSALSSISGCVPNRIVRHNAISRGRIDKAVAIIFYVHRLKK